MKAIELSQMIALIMEDYGPDMELQMEVNGLRMPITSCDVDNATEDIPTHNGLVIVIS
jgi:hypothetical protein